MKSTMNGRVRIVVLTMLVCLVTLNGFVVGQDSDSTKLPDLKTAAEATNYRATATSSAVIEFVDAVAAQADHVRRFEFGKTTEGRSMVGAIVANPKVTSPADLSDDKRLVVLIIANIHSGECCGKEAMLRMLRELAGQSGHQWLKHLVLLVVPNYNADGNDRYGKDNRPGQVGPATGMGQRANAQGFDLNREYMKLESPEARALVGLMNKWNPHCFIDCHTTNGSWHRYQLTYDVQHNPACDAILGKFMRQSMMPVITKRLQSRDVATFYYGNFNRDHTRWSTYDDKPRFGLDYVGMRGRLSILSEAYSYITYRERIEATHAFVSECLKFLASDSLEIQKMLKQVELRTIAAGCNPGAKNTVAIRAKLVAFDKKILIKGFDPPRQPRVRGADLIPGVRPKPPGKPKDYEVDFYGRFEATKTVQRPFAYLVPKNLDGIIERLVWHGIKVEKLTRDTSLKIEVYRCQKIHKAEREFQKHRFTTVEVEVRTETRDIPKGTWVVRSGQPLGTLLVYLLEPESDDGLVTWNFFDEQIKVSVDYPILRIVSARDLPTAVSR